MRGPRHIARKLQNVVVKTIETGLHDFGLLDHNPAQMRQLGQERLALAIGRAQRAPKSTTLRRLAFRLASRSRQANSGNGVIGASKTCPSRSNSRPPLCDAFSAAATTALWIAVVP